MSPFNLSIILPSSIIDCALLNIMSVSRGIGLLQRPPLSALHFQLIRVKERGRGRFKDKEEEGGRGADKRRRGEGGDRPKRAFSPERRGEKGERALPTAFEIGRLLSSFASHTSPPPSPFSERIGAIHPPQLLVLPLPEKQKGPPPLSFFPSRGRGLHF